MQKTKIMLLTALLSAFSLTLQAQYGKQDNTYKRWFVGSTVFLLGNLAPTNPHRAYHTKLPDGFKQLDDKWPKFIFGEPGFHFGFNF